MGSRTKLQGKKRLSRRKSCILRRKLKRLAKMQADLETQNKSNDPSVKLLRDVTNSEINTETTHCFQIKEEQIDINEEKIDAYNERSVPCEIIEHCKDNKGFIFVNVNNLEETDECNEGSTHNDTIECYEHSKDLISINIDDAKTEGYKKKDICNQSIEYSKNKDNNPVNAFKTLQNIPTGRCIVDFSFMWSEIHKIFNDHTRGPDCQFKYWKLVNCHGHGLLTQFFFKCEMCHYEASIWSEPVGTKTPDINAAAVTASVVTGIPSSHMRKLLTSLNIVYTPEKINRKH